MLKITASLAGGIPVDLRDTITGLDDRNIQLLLTAIRRAAPGGRPDIMAGGDSGTGARLGWRWDVALSFAGAQREYVGQVAAVLKERGLRCFYDADEQIGLWGKYLAEELPAIYGEQAAAVVVFISAEYAERDWTILERRAALGRAVRERREYVLPARFDDTPLPGLLSDMVDLRRYTPERFAAMIVAKLAGLDIAAPVPSAVPLAGPVDLVLEVTADQVRLVGGGVEVSTGHGGVRPGLAEAVSEARRARARAVLPVRDLAGTQAAGGELPLGRAGRLLAESFLPGPVAGELERVLAAAERAHQPVWLAGYLEVVRPWSNGHVYQDYPVRDLADYRWAYWADAFPSLLAVKQKYDPGNLFDFEQSITPPPEGATVSSAPARFGSNEIERPGRGRRKGSSR